MIVDLVRASNYQRYPGVVSDGRRLNVSLSRQENALTIVGDKACIKVEVTGDHQEDKKTLEKRNATNRYIIQLFKWMENKDRLIEVHGESLYQKYDNMSSAAVGTSEPASADNDIAPTSAPAPANNTVGWDSGASGDSGTGWV